ncbi:hypothetical protein HF086_016211 [Spodoptera exigua]|uniref:Phenoloxidase-activating factor 2 n=1 Tax=Spodoptera exigua TaxID=7107 RepID=A0A922SHC1_SPOEX|nr:hypothetical protein HF086_016211 [Spodoptera exigua]
MRWSTITFILLPIIFASTTAEWSWGGKEDSKTADESQQNASPLLQGEQLPEAQEKNFESNSTVLDDIVDELVSSKQGRSLGGFDDVYSDPTIKEALDSGDDAEARNLIKGRLCTLGLIQCEDEDSQEKRTYLSPDEVIYAQPVDIKPIGKPIASIPVRGPPRAYGPPQPMSYRPRPQKIPPKRVGYGGNVRPGFSDKYGVAGGNFQFSQNSALYNAHESNFVTKSPIYATPGPYAYENTKPAYNKYPSHSDTKTDTVVQQHIHHHYVHEDNKDPKVIIKPVAIPVGSVGQLNTQSFGSQFSGSQSSDIISGGGDYSSITSGGFKPMSGGFNPDTKPIYESDTIYGSQYGHQSNKVGHNGNILTQGLPNQFNNNAFEDQKYGNGLGSYASQNNEFYKKELHVGSQNNIYNQGPSTFGQSNGYVENYHEAKAQNFDCVCVNYDQCPSQEVIGRRDDLYLPIDPRNKASEISALTEEQLDNLNKTDTATATAESTTNATETKKLSKRETKEETPSEAAKEAEPRSPRYPGFNEHTGHDQKHVEPTFGVSFALPQGPQTSNFHPLNPHLHPFSNAIMAGGINLGLAVVNPLLSLQVTKTVEGEKIYKPLLHFHVTPSQSKLRAITQIFDEKKQYLLNKHQHYHVHQPFPPVYPINPGPAYPPHYPPPRPHYPHPPPNYVPPHVHNGPPIYSPHYTDYKPYSYHGNSLPSGGYHDYEDDSDPNYDSEDYPQTYYRSLHYNDRLEKVTDVSDQATHVNRSSYSRSLNLPSKPPRANRGYQTIRFPETRRKREIDVGNMSVIIEERQGYFGRPPVQQCRPNQVCCRRPLQPQAANKGQCGIRHSQGINGRIKTPAYVDGESEFGEYPWQTAILKKDPKESVYVCGGTLIDGLHILTAAHCVKSYKGFELRVRLGEWDVNRDVEFYPYIERDIVSVHVHPLYYAGTLDNDLAILKMDHPVEWTKYPHISPACLPDKYTDYSGQRCWTTGWGKDAFGDYGKYQNILKEVDVPILSHGQCQQQLRQTRLGYNYELNPGFTCAGGEEGKDACKGDGGGPLVCERSGTWQIVGVVSWGIGCGQPGVPGVYVKVAHYLDWISQITGKFSPY